MALIETWRKKDLESLVQMEYLDGVMFTQDNMANLIGIELYEDGEPYPGGGSVSANVIRSDGGTVAVTGTISGNKASVTLPQACYAEIGPVFIIMKLTVDTTVTTIGSFCAVVYKSTTGATVDPGTLVSSVQTLISNIETAAASFSDYAGMVAAIAPPYSSSAKYPVGFYAWQNEQLYRCTTPITSGETFNSAHWELADLGSGLSRIAAADTGLIFADAGAVWEQGTVSSSNGGYSPSTNRIRTNYVQCLSRRGLHVVVPSGYKINAIVFTSKAVNGYSYYYTGALLTHDFDIFITPGQYVRCVCGRTDNADFTPAEMPDVCIYENVYTDTQLNKAYKAAESKTVGDRLRYNYDELTGGLYGQQYVKTDYEPTWESGMVNPSTGGLVSSSKHIRTGYIHILNDLPIQITAPDTIKCIIYKYSKQDVNYYEDYDQDYVIGSRRYISDQPYIRIVACKTDGSDISTVDAEDITVSRYSNTQSRDINVATFELDKILEKKTISATWEQGKISTVNGGVDSSDYHIRTGYIRVMGGNSFRVDFPEGFKLTVLEYDSQSYLGYQDTPIASEDTTGCIMYHSPMDIYIRVMAQYVTEEEMDLEDDPTIPDGIVISQYYGKQELNILVLGNSFSMDSFAYLPPVLNEALPEYKINYGVAYSPSFSIQDHIDLYNETVDPTEPRDQMKRKYRLFWEWDYKTGKWKRYTSYTSGQTLPADRGKTLDMIMAWKSWDIIYLQPAATVTDAQYAVSQIITPGRTFLRLLQSLAQKPFTFLMGEWLGTIDSYGDHGETVFGMIAQRMQEVQAALGIDGIIPIGAAIQDARTNATLQALGAGGNMLYNDYPHPVHMQSGIAPLIAAYTIAMYILRMMGKPMGLKGSSFIPTTENCIAINAYFTGTGTPMTHGESVGVTTANIRAAQEIASVAIRYPFEVKDCSAFIPS